MGGAGGGAVGMTSYSASDRPSACFTAPYAILLVMIDGSLQCMGTRKCVTNPHTIHIH